MDPKDAWRVACVCSANRAFEIRELNRLGIPMDFLAEMSSGEPISGLQMLESIASHLGVEAEPQSRQNKRIDVLKTAIQEHFVSRGIEFLEEPEDDEDENGS